MNTQWERRVADLERALAEVRAMAEGYRLALAQAQAEVRKLLGQASLPADDTQASALAPSKKRGLSRG
jgi:hypothetical protein